MQVATMYPSMPLPFGVRQLAKDGSIVRSGFATHTHTHISYTHTNTQLQLAHVHKRTLSHIYYHSRTVSQSSTGV